MAKKFFDYILQGSEATEENAFAAARGLDWQEVDNFHVESYPDLDYVDTVNGVGIWYAWKVDSYYFTDETSDIMETKKVRISKEQLQQIIKEGVAKLHRQTIIENRIKQINEELSGMMSEWDEEDKDYLSPYPKGLDAAAIEELMAMSEVDFLEEILSNGYSLDEQKGIIEHRIQHLKGYPQDKPEFDSEKQTFSAMGAINETPEVAEEHDVMEILKHYLEAAVWADSDEEWMNTKTGDDVDRASVVNALEDVKTFVEKAGGLLDGMQDSDIGHNLWLTRQGHGVGFWDRGLGEKGEALSDIARSMGSKSLYLGDDNKVHIE